MIRLSAVFYFLSFILGAIALRVDHTEYFEQGNILKNADKIYDSVPFYRAAVRLDPKSVQYLTSLGIAEYQSKLYSKSFRRFQKLLTLDSTSKIAKYHLAQLIKKDLNLNAVQLDGTYTSLNNDDNFADDYLNLPELTQAVMNDQHITSYFHSPFVVRQGLSSSSRFELFSPTSLNASHGAQTVDFYPQNMLARPEKVYTVPLSEALEFLAYPEGAYLSVDASEEGTYIQWNVDQTKWAALLLSAQLRLPSVLADSLRTFLTAVADAQSENAVRLEESTANRFGLDAHWFMLLVGERGAGMFRHQDVMPVGSWQAQMLGSKQWTICAPALPPSSIVGPCYRATVEAGDVLYYPPHYWHETRNLASPSVALSGTVVVESRLGELMEHLRSKCGFSASESGSAAQTAGIAFDAEVCSYLFHQ